MDIVTLALAATLNCQQPETKDVIGLWESTSISRGGIGHNFEFREDGSYTSATTVLVDLKYDIKDGSFYMSHNKGEPINYENGAEIEITKSGYKLNKDGEVEVKTKEHPSKDKTIVGVYKYRHYTGGMAYEKYTDDGEIKFRLPMKSISGCYSINGNSITVTQEDKNSSKMKYIATKDTLSLESQQGKYTYSIVPEGSWYESKEIDYQKPVE